MCRGWRLTVTLIGDTAQLIYVQPPYVTGPYKGYKVAQSFFAMISTIGIASSSLTYLSGVFLTPLFVYRWIRRVVTELIFSRHGKAVHRHLMPSKLANNIDLCGLTLHLPCGLHTASFIEKEVCSLTRLWGRASHCWSVDHWFLRWFLILAWYSHSSHTTILLFVVLPDLRQKNALGKLLCLASTNIT